MDASDGWDLDLDLLDGMGGDYSSSSRIQKSREELNEIEKMRTRKLNNLILSLKTLLDSSNVITKKDKLSILKNTHEYVNRLKEALDDAEDRYTRLKIKSAGPLVPQTLSSESLVRFDDAFSLADAPMAIVNVNGQFLDCNTAFSDFSGCSRDDVKALSLFRICAQRDLTLLFNVVATLVAPPDPTNTSASKRVHQFLMHLQLSPCTDPQPCVVSLSVVRETDGSQSAKYFQLVVLSSVLDQPSQAQDVCVPSLLSLAAEEVRRGRAEAVETPGLDVDDSKGMAILRGEEADDDNLFPDSLSSEEKQITRSRQDSFADLFIYPGRRVVRGNSLFPDSFGVFDMNAFSGREVTREESCSSMYGPEITPEQLQVLETDYQMNAASRDLDDFVESMMMGGSGGGGGGGRGERDRTDSMFRFPSEG